MEAIIVRLEECREKRAQGVTALTKIQEEAERVSVAVHQMDGMIAAYEEMLATMQTEGETPPSE